MGRVGEGMAGKTVAVVGASADRSKFGNKSIRAHRKQGWQVFPVNARGGEIEGLPVYRTLKDIPARIDRVSLYVPPAIGRAAVARNRCRAAGGVFRESRRGER